MADGREYQVPHRDSIFFPPRGAFVVVDDDAAHVFVLPLGTMTGLAYPSEASDSKTSSPGYKIAAENETLRGHQRGEEQEDKHHQEIADAKSPGRSGGCRRL